MLKTLRMVWSANCLQHSFADICRKSWCFPHYAVHDASGHEVFTIKGPQEICIGSTTSRKYRFNILGLGGAEHSVGQITMRCSEVRLEMIKGLYVRCKWNRANFIFSNN